MPEEMELQSQQHQRIKELHDALDDGQITEAKVVLRELPPVDIALVLEASPPAERKLLWQLTKPEQQGEILEELNEDVMEGVLQLLEPEQVAEVTEGMDTDDLAYVLRGLPEDDYQAVLEQMTAQDRHRVEAALAYPEDTAGSIMNTDTITLRPDVSVDVVLRYLRLRGELPEATDALYVVDKQDRLIGDVPLAVLLTVDPQREVGDIMDRSAETIPVAMDDGEVAALFERHDWISAPVVDEEGKLLGRITIDDVVDVIREDAEHSMMGMAGMDDDEDTFAPVLKSTQRRTVWLAVNLCTALIAASISNMFENTLEALATLAVLMTIVPSMGGIAGNQTLALVIRGMAVGHIGQGNTRWLIGKEAAIGMLNGVIWALAIGLVVSLWKGSLMLGLIISTAMFANMAIAGLAGVLIPITMKRYNIDPALAGGMALTTVTDVMGLFTFLGMATLLLR
ncbi:magnesium transporter [Aliagarivorans taiwanensis]|uniref:magnesium transporter n=1 Tax=Aliagarivorans taiwanensis TaxID=561966 RepID=UPI0003FC4302|nr:magnesium transporter [Aliagarivorans taiwanensis]